MFIAVLVLLLPLASSETIANLFEWSHYDVGKECKHYLRNHGYDAVQVTPVMEHVILDGDPWYERYQPFSYNLVSRSGDAFDLKMMVEACNEAKVKVYVDVVINHMSTQDSKGFIGTYGSKPDIPNKKYPDVPYGPEHFHPSCGITNKTDPWQIRNCELVSLQDLNQTLEYVRGKIVNHLNELVDIGVAGFRVDAAKHMDPADLEVIYSRVHNLNTRWFPAHTKPYYYHEVFSGPTDAVNPNHYLSIGDILDFRYGYEVAKAFLNGNPLKWYSDLGTAWGLMPWSKSVVFIDNHDSQRSGKVFGSSAVTFKTPRAYKMASGFMLAFPHERALVMSSFNFTNSSQGPPPYPVIMGKDGACLSGWICEHRWRQISNMAIFAKVVKGTKMKNWWTNGNGQIAFCRGNKGFVAFNNEKNDLDTNLQTCLPQGIYCDVVSGRVRMKTCTGKVLFVRKNGYARIRIPSTAEDGFIAIHINAMVPVYTPTVSAHLQSGKDCRCFSNYHGQDDFGLQAVCWYDVYAVRVGGSFGWIQ